MRTHSLITVLFLLLPGCASTHHRFEYTRLTMGVEARIVLYAPERSHADLAADAAYARLAQLDAIMSDYRQDSELMQLCRQPAGTPVRVSDDLFTVVRIAQRVSHASGGAFDITVGSLVKRWREARQSLQLPRPDEIASARMHVGYEHITLDEEFQTITLNCPGAGVQLDLGGIGKGYAAQQAIETLREHDIHSALVALAGDIAVSDAPPDQRGWRIVIVPTPHAGSDQREDPDPARGQGSSRMIGLTNASISTSGSNQQFIEISGTRYSHLIDPRTGLGLTSETIVTVIARGPNGGALADALSSAACVLGPEAGAALVDQFPDCEAIISHVD